MLSLMNGESSAERRCRLLTFLGMLQPSCYFRVIAIHVSAGVHTPGFSYKLYSQPTIDTSQQTTAV